ncbi:hypothetical protein [Streptomyces sp. NPDC048357]|uniref:hypothetical protein n=1 Tax=Streptomyces sp. NPDC048357 TaxID=3154719 RepID=UPI0034470DBF
MEEMLAWLEHGRSYDHRYHRDAWRSVIRDFQYAAAWHTGPHLQRAMEPLLPHTAAGLSNLITDEGKLDDDAKATALQACSLLRGRLAAPEVLTAAWDDLASACQEPDQDSELVLIRRDVLLALFRLTGRDTRVLVRRLRGILGDNRSDVDFARAAIDSTGPYAPTVDLSVWRSPAGLSEQERLDLCRDVISVQPQPAHHVVWFAVSGLPYNPPPAIGERIQFHTAGWLAVLRDAENRRGIGLPEELIDDSSGVCLEDLPGGADAHLARVDLGDGCWSDVAARAMELLHQAFSGLAQYGADAGPQVLRSAGFLHVRDARKARRRYNPSFAPDHNSTARAADRAADLLAYLEQSQNVDGLRDDLDALGKIESADGRGALALAQNILENRFRGLEINRDWERGREGDVRYGWYSYAKEFLADAWVSAVLSTDLHSGADALWGTMPESSEARRRLLDVRRSVIVYGRGSTFLDRSAFMAALPTVLDHVGPAPHTLRQLHALNRRCATPESRARWAKETRERFDLGVDRWRRIRNAHQHGGPAATDDAIGSVRGLAVWLARTAIDVTTGPVARRESSYAAHRQFAKQLRSWRRGLVTATALDQLQWP